MNNRARFVGVDKALLQEIRSGAQKTLRNAEALYNEARILMEAGALSRALFLHQISLEECAKVEIMGAWATSLLMGHTVDMAKLKRALASHATKNRTNAYFLQGSTEEQAANSSGDAAQAIEAFQLLQQEFHVKSNTAKNASLYVDYQDNRFAAPQERVAPGDVENIRALNEQFLTLTAPKVRLLGYITSKPDRYSSELANFEKCMHELKSEFPNDPRRAMDLLLEELLGGKLREIMSESISDTKPDTPHDRPIE